MVEGRLPFRGHETWYRIVGEADAPGRLPLICLHGGPGSTHNYFEPLEALAATGRRVVLYDQLGCGDSDRPDDPSLWTMELFVDELRAVRERLGLERCHVLGSSWGGMLALEYALTQPEGLLGLVLSSTLSSSRLWVAEAERLLAELGQGAGEEELEQAHFCRLDPLPECVQRGRAKRGDSVYETMWGPNEFTCTGVLRDWDVTERLGEIRVPTLVASGRYDMSTPAVSGALHRGIPGSDWVVFEQSAHVPFLEEPERYLEVLDAFLTRAESLNSPQGV